MTTFQYMPIDDATVRAVRETLHDAHGNALRVHVSDSDTAPCRSCLRATPRGTRLILLAHRPFATEGPYAETGPVFIHADECRPYRAQNVFPPDFRPRRLVFRAYDAAGAIHDAMLADGADAEQTVAHMFASASVARVHVRNPAWGCFDFAVERS
ncbi:MAG TPA: DUF1203 domain-containing protein [Candidatus Elarobacter sp.]